MKMHDHECDVVRDLLPLYIENRTGDESNRLIRRHLEQCIECSEVYRNMTAELSPMNMPEGKRGNRRKKHIIRADVLIAGVCVILYAAVLCGLIYRLLNVLTAGLF